MVTSDLEKLPSEWARAWSSSNDSERLLALFADDCRAHTKATSRVCPRLASAFHRSEARPSSN
jgi:hypothetical protein